MGNLVITEFVTLDGVMQDPGGAEKDSFPQGGWAFAVERGGFADVGQTGGVVTVVLRREGG